MKPTVERLAAHLRQSCLSPRTPPQYCRDALCDLQTNQFLTCIQMQLTAIVSVVMQTHRNPPHFPPNDFHGGHSTNCVATVQQRLKSVGNRSVCIHIHIIYCLGYLTHKSIYQILILNWMSRLSYQITFQSQESIPSRVLSQGITAIDDRKSLILVQTSAKKAA